MTEENENKKQDQEWTDDADIVKHLTEIHSKNTNLSGDFVLFQGQDEQKEFIRMQLTIADRVRDFIQDEQTAKETAQTLIRECQSIAVLERNKPENWFVDKLITRDITNEEDQNKGRMDEALTKILGDKK